MRLGFNILSALLMVAAIPANAVVSRQRPVEMTAPDGTPVTVVPVGDEHSRHYVDLAGNPVEWPESSGSVKSFVPVARAGSRDNLRAPDRITTFPTIGDKRFLVVLVEFADVGFNISSPRDEMDAMFNSSGYDTLGGTGSVRDYYIDCSGGKFRPHFDVVGPVKLSQGYVKYGGGSDDSLAGLMVVEACKAIDGQVDFRDYDLDGNGEVDSVYFIYAGKGEADGGDAGTIWPHSWNLSDQGRSLNLDGVDIQGYACSPELDGSGKLNGMGTPCHEFAHVLGLPDLYCTASYVTCLDPGEWSLMASGNYNNDGRTPPMLSAYERYELGWLEPKELSHPITVTLRPASETEGDMDACRISTERRNEYFLLENRQQTGWDAFLPGHGMLVWHIDYNPNIWDRNRVNATPGHQYVDIVEANNATSHTLGSGFPFPGTGHVTSFTSITRPALVSWSGVAIDLPLTSIAEDAHGNITFDVAGGKLPLGTPTVLHADVIGMESASLQWESVEGALGYNVMITETVEEGDVAEEASKMSDVTGGCTQTVVSGLWPGKKYVATVRAYDQWEQGMWSAPAELEMPEPTFDYMQVEVLSPSQVTPVGFIASWLPLDGTERYLVDVAERTRSGGFPVVCDFTGKKLPQGYESTSSTWVSMAGFYGEASPSLRLGSDGDMLLTDIMPSGISSVSFWLRGANPDGDAVLYVDGDIGASNWKTIYKTEVPEDASSINISVASGDMPEGVVRICFRLEKGKRGTVNIDDIHLLYGESVTEIPIERYTRADAGSACSLAVECLSPGCSYVYRVQAVSFDGAVSRMSRAVELTTPVSDGLPSVSSESRQNVEYFDIHGRKVDVPSAGIYIRRIGNEVTKILVKP